MPNATRDDVRALSVTGEFDAVADATIDAILAEVGSTIGVPPWDETMADYAHASLAAHVLALRMRGAGASYGGPVTSESAGDVSRSYGYTSGLASESYYMTTIYGQEYLRLFKLQALSPIAGSEIAGVIYNG